MATSYANSQGLIEPTILYRWDEAAKRMGWGRKAADAARRRGLKTMRTGKRVYVKGSELLAFVERDSASHDRKPDSLPA